MKTENSLLRWLKRIFSLQTISVLVAIVGVYFAYKSFMHNKETSITIEIYDDINDKFINIDEASIILTMYYPNSDEQESVDFYDEEEKCPVLLPYIHNNSDKSLKNFKCEVSIMSLSDEFDLEENAKYINPNYQVQSSEDYDVVLRYKGNALPAQSELPSPLRSWNYDITEDLFLEYSISYDGLSKPMVIYQSINIIDDEKVFTDDKLIWYLESVFYPKFIPSRYKTEKDKYAIVISKGREFRVVKGQIEIKPEYESEMEKYQKEILERNRQRASDEKQD